MLASICIVLLFRGTAQEQDSLPVNVPQVTIEGRNAGICPSAAVTEQALNNTKETIRSILHDTVVPSLDNPSTVVPSLDNPSTCPCGGPGLWRRIAHLDMSDPDQQCPSNWRLITTPVRACGRTSSACDSAVFPSNGASYSRVCGRINAFQQGSTSAFDQHANGNNIGLDGPYVEGVSVTHGAAGSRQHIWTFATALYEASTSYDPSYVCACTDTNSNWPHQTPSFIENNYFCDTGNPGPGSSLTEVYQDDPLWDGEGCGPRSTCCQFNNPPWFCTTLPQPTTDDIELRICCDQHIGDEDVLIHLVDIYIK